MMSFVAVAFSPDLTKSPDFTQSVVLVLPVWPGQSKGGAGQEPGKAPEGSGISIAPGVIVTAWHIIEPAERIDVRLSDGRAIPAELIASDAQTNITGLTLEAQLPVASYAEDVSVTELVCAAGHAFGLGVSITCGLVSALGISNAGSNPIEDFVQTDAAINPGMSGGALFDHRGRRVGMISSIYASEGDGNIGATSRTCDICVATGRRGALSRSRDTRAHRRTRG